MLLSPVDKYSGAILLSYLIINFRVRHKRYVYDFPLPISSSKRTCVRVRSPLQENIKVKREGSPCPACLLLLFFAFYENTDVFLKVRRNIIWRFRNNSLLWDIGYMNCRVYIRKYNCIDYFFMDIILYRVNHVKITEYD